MNRKETGHRNLSQSFRVSKSERDRISEFSKKHNIKIIDMIFTYMEIHELLEKKK